MFFEGEVRVRNCLFRKSYILFWNIDLLIMVNFLCIYKV